MKYFYTLILCMVCAFVAFLSGKQTGLKTGQEQAAAFAPMAVKVDSVPVKNNDIRSSKDARDILSSIGRLSYTDIQSTLPSLIADISDTLAAKDRKNLIDELANALERIMEQEKNAALALLEKNQKEREVVIYWKKEEDPNIRSKAEDMANSVTEDNTKTAFLREEDLAPAIHQLSQETPLDEINKVASSVAAIEDEKQRNLFVDELGKSLTKLQSVAIISGDGSNNVPTSLAGNEEVPPAYVSAQIEDAGISFESKNDEIFEISEQLLNTQDEHNVALLMKDLENKLQEQKIEGIESSE